MAIAKPLNVLTDGFPTLFGFGTGPDDEEGNQVWGIEVCEKRLKPFGVDGGGPNDTTCMRNTRWRTRQSKCLVTLTEMSITVSYDPLFFTDLLQFVQFNQIMWIAWPDGSGVTFWGFVDSFEPHEITEGTQPEADVKVCPTNQDNSGLEVEPEYFAEFWEPQANCHQEVD